MTKRKQRHIEKRQELQSRIYLHQLHAEKYRDQGMHQAMHQNIIRANEAREQLHLHTSFTARLVRKDWFHRSLTCLVWVVLILLGYVLGVMD